MKNSALLLACILSFGSAIGHADEPTPPSFTTTLEQRTGEYLGMARELALNALSLLGINYKYGGNSPATGFDCSGFVRHVFSQVTGRLLPRDARTMAGEGAHVERDELQPGDLVFFNTRRKPYSHVGIYLGDRRFVHAPARGGSVEVVDMTDRYWNTRYNGARRVAF